MRSLVFDKLCPPSKKAVTHEPDLSQGLGEAAQHLVQCERGAAAQRPGVTRRLAQYLQWIDQPRGPAPGTECQSGRQAAERQPDSPYPRPSRLPNTVTLGRSAVQIGTMRKGVAAA